MQPSEFEQKKNDHLAGSLKVTKEISGLTSYFPQRELVKKNQIRSG